MCTNGDHVYALFNSVMTLGSQNRSNSPMCLAILWAREAPQGVSPPVHIEPDADERDVGSTLVSHEKQRECHSPLIAVP